MYLDSQGKMRFDEAELADSSGTNSLAKGELGSCSSYTLLSIAEHLKKALSSTELATFKCNHTPSQVRQTRQLKRREKIICNI